MRRLALASIVAAIVAATLSSRPAHADGPSVERPDAPPATGPSTLPSSASGATPGTAPSTNSSTAPSTGPSTSPSTSPTTSPSTTQSASQVPPPAPFPPEFSLLLTRSAFAVGPVKSGQAKANEPPEAKLGLRGVGEQDGQFVALVEDMGSKAVQRLKREDKVASGSIKAIDLDGIVYENGGKQTRVTIGNNLLGAPLPAPPPPPPKPPAAGPQPGQPGGPPQPGMEGQPQPGQPGRPPRLPRG